MSDMSFMMGFDLSTTVYPSASKTAGKLQHLKRDLKVTCLPSDLPDHIDLDVSALDIGNSI